MYSSVPAERAFVLASDLKVRPLDGLELFTNAKDNVGKVGDGNDFLAIGGHVALDPDRGDILAEVLPPLISRRRELARSLDNTGSISTRP